MRFLALAVLAGLLGCSADGTGDGSSRSSGSRGGTTPGATNGGTAGAAAPAAAGDSGGFGNTTATAPTAPSNVVNPEEECEDGQRCASDTLDVDDCGSLMLETSVEVIENPGNLMVIFDRSGSMNQNWDQRAKSQAAGEALQAAIDPLTDLLTVGAILFPSPNQLPTSMCPPGDLFCGIGELIVGSIALAAGSCEVNPISEIDQIQFVPGIDFLQQFPDKWALSEGSTPLGAGVQQAATAMNGTTFDGEVAVVVITDGEPNCETNMESVYQQADAWLAQGIETHVIGLPGADSGNAQALLTELAVRGGTNDFIVPTDPAELEQRLREIVNETISGGLQSCEIAVDPPAEAPDDVHMIVTENGVQQSVARDLSDDASWNVSADGSLITLSGLLCEDAQTGRFENIRFEFGCVDYPPLPPQRPE